MPTTAPPMLTGRFGAPISLKRADDAGSVEAVFSTATVVDSYGDRVLSSAFKDGQHVPMVWSHDLDRPIGRGVVRVEPKQAVLVGRFFLETARGADAYRTVKAMGELQQWSFGYIEREAVKGDQGEKVISRLDLLEVSPVVLGANSQTYTASLKSAGGSDIMTSASRGVRPVDDSWEDLAARARQHGIAVISPTHGSIGQRVAASHELAELKSGRTRAAVIRLPDIEAKALISAPIGTRVLADSSIDAGALELSFVDFLPQLTTEAATIQIPRNTTPSGALAVAAATAATGTSGTKPEIITTYTGDSVTTVNVAGYVTATSRIIADGSAFGRIVDADVRAAVKDELERQVLAGSGTGANMTGLWNTVGVGTVAAVAGNSVGALVAAIATARLASRRMPDVCAINSASWTALLVATTASGAPNALGQLALVGRQISILGIPLVPSDFLASGTALVGAASTAPLYSQTGITIVSGVVGDQFARNIVTIRGEIYSVVAVLRPSAWCRVTGLGV